MGASTGRLERSGQQADFDLNATALLKDLNILVGLRFFDLPNEVIPVPRLALRADGTVVSVSLPLHDVGSTEVCVALADARHCVRYSRDGPAELEAWVQTRLAAASKHLPAVPSIGGARKR